MRGSCTIWYMITEGSVEVDAPASVVWDVFADVEQWPSWTWRQKSLGGTTLASHEVVPQGPDRTLVRQRIDQRGPVGVMVGLLMRRLTRRYLDLEAQGLKSFSEQRRSRHRSPA